MIPARVYVYLQSRGNIPVNLSGFLSDGTVHSKYPEPGSFLLLDAVSANVLYRRGSNNDGITGGHLYASWSQFA